MHRDVTTFHVTLPPDVHPTWVTRLQRKIHFVVWILLPPVALAVIVLALFVRA